VRVGEEEHSRRWVIYGIFSRCSAIPPVPFHAWNIRERVSFECSAGSAVGIISLRIGLTDRLDPRGHHLGQRTHTSVKDLLTIARRQVTRMEDPKKAFPKFIR
jgi:hypothetical protein